jgi:hypothetical protein
MPPLGESVKSGNRMSKMTAAERLAMEARFGEKKRPSPADSAKSANRIAKEEAAEARHLGVFKEGGKVRKYAEGGAVEPVMNLRRMEGSMPVFDGSNPEAERAMRKQVGQTNESLYGFNASSAYQNLGANLKDMIDSGQLTIEQANALKAPAFEATRLRDVGQQRQAMDAALGAAYAKMPMPLGVGSAPGVGVRAEPKRPEPPTYPTYYDKIQPQVMPPMMMEPAPLKMMERMEPQMPQMPPPLPPMKKIYDKFRPQVMPPLMMEQPTPPLQNLGQVLQRIQQKQPPVDRGFIDRMPRMNVPEGPPPAGMAPVDPNKAMMMKHGGRAAMSKGKR